MTDDMQEIVVSPQEAVFWLDRWGHWCNAHGRFEHKKIIDYFHAAIARDDQGYYVSQVNGNILEKVYFRYEDTALFVFDMIEDDGITLVLNTRQHLRLEPESLFIYEDNLYVRHGNERIKFNQACMVKISRFMEYHDDRCYIRMMGRRIVITEEDGDAGRAIDTGGRLPDGLSPP